jgi:hypothetical protein
MTKPEMQGFGSSGAFSLSSSTIRNFVEEYLGIISFMHHFCCINVKKPKKVSMHITANTPRHN